MLNYLQIPLVQNWVKNVYSLCVEGMDTCGRIYTTIHIHRIRIPNIGVQLQSYTHLTTSFTLVFFTGFFRNLYLLLRRYTHFPQHLLLEPRN